MPLILSSSINLTGAVSAPTIIIQNGGGGIVSSSQQIQNYNTFAVTSSVSTTFYGNLDVGGNITGSGTSLINGVSYLGGQNTIQSTDKPHFFRINGGGLGISANNEGVGAQPIKIYTDGSQRVQVTGGGTTEVTGSFKVGTSSSDYAASFTNINDGSQGVLVRTTDNDSSLYIARLQSSPTSVSEAYVDRLTLTKDGTLSVSGKAGIGASTAPTYKLEVSTAGGSERIRVGTLQNNNNTATFEAITTSDNTTATSGWIRALYGGGLAVGTSTYGKTGGDSGNFANLSSEATATAFTVNGGNTTLSGGMITSYTSVTSGYVNETQTITAFTNSYFLYKYTGTNNGSSQTTFNLTGLPATNGTIIDVVLHVAKDGTAGAINTAAIFNINGYDPGIGTVFASGTGGVNTIRTFRVGRFDGTWRIIGQIGLW